MIITQRRVILSKTFEGGVLLPSNKYLTKNIPIDAISLPSKVIIPFTFYGGKECKPIVKEGDEVYTGQVLCEPQEHISAFIHSSISGVIKKIGEFPHPIFKKSYGALIESDGKDSKGYNGGERNWQNLSKEEILNIIKEAGVVGLGGAGFPTHAKLRIQDKKQVDAFLINLIECEPYITVDERLAIERFSEILSGINILLKVLEAKKAYLAVADGKKELIEHLKVNTSTNENIEVIVLKRKYPQGEEKQLVKAALGRIIPKGKLPCDVGVVVDNLQTVFAVFEAVCCMKPFYERVITVTGQAIKQPKNLLVRIGTRLQDVIDYCGGLQANKLRVIFGGPMMGIAQDNLDMPITKEISAVIFIPFNKNDELNESSCIRCGACIDVCPMGLLPLEMNKIIKIKKWDELEAYNISECMLCGACAYACPAQIPLVARMALGKKALINIKKVKLKKDGR